MQDSSNFEISALLLVIREPQLPAVFPKSEYRFTFPSAAVTESEIPRCRPFIESRNSRISFLTLSFSPQTHAMGRNPWTRAYSVDNSSETNTSGRISRSPPLRDSATGGRDAILPLNRMLRKSDSEQSSAVCPNARTVQFNSDAML